MFKKIKRKNIEWGIAIGLVCSIFLSVANFSAACEDLKSNVLRLHIIANSDTSADQNLKLMVRDEILKYSNISFENCETLEDAKKVAKEDIEEIERIAQRKVYEQGYDYKVTVNVCESFFETRVYDDFILPAGKYESLTVKIGEAGGHNWWCVIFPSICLPAASNASLSDTATQKSAEIAQNGQKYIVRFKIIEIYEKLKKFL